MNANRLRKKNKVNGLAPTFRRKMEYLMDVNNYCYRNMKDVISVINYNPIVGIGTAHIVRINNETHYLD